MECMRENGCLHCEGIIAQHGTERDCISNGLFTIVYSLIIQEQILKFVCSFLFYLSSSSLHPRSSFDGPISLNMNCSAV